jgi:hypothetical protein
MEAASDVNPAELPTRVARFDRAPLLAIASIPAYHLLAAHRLLMQNDTFRAQAHLTASYLGVRRGLLAELTR